MGTPSFKPSEPFSAFLESAFFIYLLGDLMSASCHAAVGRIEAMS
jgi:hypothetical protein